MKGVQGWSMWWVPLCTHLLSHYPLGPCRKNRDISSWLYFSCQETSSACLDGEKVWKTFYSLDLDHLIAFSAVSFTSKCASKGPQNKCYDSPIRVVFGILVHIRYGLLCWNLDLIHKIYGWQLIRWWMKGMGNLIRSPPAMMELEAVKSMGLAGTGPLLVGQYWPLLKSLIFLDTGLAHWQPTYLEIRGT